MLLPYLNLVKPFLFVMVVVFRKNVGSLKEFDSAKQTPSHCQPHWIWTCNLLVHNFYAPWLLPPSNHICSAFSGRFKLCFCSASVGKATLRLGPHKQSWWWKFASKERQRSSRLGGNTPGHPERRWTKRSKLWSQVEESLGQERWINKQPVWMRYR